MLRTALVRSLSRLADSVREAGLSLSQPCATSPTYSSRDRILLGARALYPAGTNNVPSLSRLMTQYVPEGGQALLNVHGIASVTHQTNTPLLARELTKSCTNL